MEEGNEKKIILGIAFLFTIITGIFSLLSRLTILISSQADIKKGFEVFLLRNILWIIVVIVIALLLGIWIKKLTQDSYTFVLENRIIRITTGVLVALEGLIGLSSSLPAYIFSIQSIQQTQQQGRIDLAGLILNTIITNTISAVIKLCQIVLGIYLVKFYKKRST